MFYHIIIWKIIWCRTIYIHLVNRLFISSFRYIKIIFLCNFILILIKIINSSILYTSWWTKLRLSRCRCTLPSLIFIILSFSINKSAYVLLFSRLIWSIKLFCKYFFFFINFLNNLLSIFTFNTFTSLRICTDFIIMNFFCFFTFTLFRIFTFFNTFFNIIICYR